jgi:hypothetical protein
MHAALIWLFSWSARGRLERAALYSPSKSISEHGLGGNANADWAVIDIAHNSMMAARTRVIICMVSS